MLKRAAIRVGLFFIVIWSLLAAVMVICSLFATPTHRGALWLTSQWFPDETVTEADRHFMACVESRSGFYEHYKGRSDVCRAQDPWDLSGADLQLFFADQIQRISNAKTPPGLPVLSALHFLAKGVIGGAVGIITNPFRMAAGIAVDLSHLLNGHDPSAVWDSITRTPQVAGALFKQEVECVVVTSFLFPFLLPFVHFV